MHRRPPHPRVHLRRPDAHQIVAHGGSCAPRTNSTQRGRNAYAQLTSGPRDARTAEQKYNAARHHEFHAQLSARELVDTKTFNITLKTFF